MSGTLGQERLSAAQQRSRGANRPDHVPWGPSRGDFHVEDPHFQCIWKKVQISLKIWHLGSLTLERDIWISSEGQTQGYRDPNLGPTEYVRASVAPDSGPSGCHTTSRVTKLQMDNSPLGCPPSPDILSSFKPSPTWSKEYPHAQAEAYPRNPWP